MTKKNSDVYNGSGDIDLNETKRTRSIRLQKQH